MPEKNTSAHNRVDAQLAQAVDFARENALEIAGESSLGEHLSFEMNAERLCTHYFACTDAGYVGWRWSVTVTRVPRSRKITVCEVDLVPGEGSLLAPEWVPWEERLQPGDVSRDDVLPYRDDDDRLESGLEDSARAFCKRTRSGCSALVRIRARPQAWASSEADLLDLRLLDEDGRLDALGLRSMCK